jgi:hypothetical protein
MCKLAALLFLLAPMSLFAKCDTVSMQYKFQIEGADFTHAAAWVGGWSHAVIASGKDVPNVCIPECESLVAKVIVDILNEKFAGQTISAETASAAIWPELKHRLTCKTTGVPNPASRATR